MMTHGHVRSALPLPGSLLRAMIDTENCHRAVFDALDNDVRQTWDDHLARPGKCPFATKKRYLTHQRDNFADSFPDPSCRVRVAFLNVISDFVEMPLGTPRDSQRHKPNFFQVSAIS